MLRFFQKRYTNLSPSEAIDRNGIRVIDVREPDEVRYGAISGAVNVPLGTLLRAGLDDTPPDEPVLLVCRSGGRSGRARGPPGLGRLRRGVQPRRRHDRVAGGGPPDGDVAGRPAMTEVITWSGVAGGVAVGTYALLQLALTGQPLGVSTGYGNACALGSKQPFFQTGSYTDRWSWRLFFLVGLPLGGVIAALTSPGAWIPSVSMGSLYDAVLPAALPARALVLVLGGVAMGFGARLAGGCTSGHAIAGLSLRNPASLAAAAGFFVGGVIAVQALFRLTGVV